MKRLDKIIIVAMAVVAVVSVGANFSLRIKLEKERGANTEKVLALENYGEELKQCEEKNFLERDET